VGKTETQMKMLYDEIKILEQNPILVKGEEILSVIEGARKIKSIISRKAHLFNRLKEQLQPRQPEPVDEYEMEEEVEEEEEAPVKLAPREMKAKMQQNRAVPEQREKELDKKVREATKPDFEEPTSESLGQDEDLELPDIDFND
jgi:hypothetical protein